MNTSATEKQTRQAIERAIPFIEEQGVDWIESKECASCHRINTMVWSLSLAKTRGFKVSKELDEWIHCSRRRICQKRTQHTGTSPENHPAELASTRLAPEKTHKLSPGKAVTFWSNGLCIRSESLTMKPILTFQI